MARVISPYVENTLKAYINKLERIQAISPRKVHLYDTGSEELDLIFSSIHVQLDDIFSKLNEHCDVRGNLFRHIDFLTRIKVLYAYVNEIYRELENTPFSFCVNKYQNDVIGLLNNYRNVSFIPEIRLFETIPMFALKYGAPILPYMNDKDINMKELGEGAYAAAKYYRDPFYGMDLVVKEAKADISAKDVERFKQEYRVMHEMSSPHVAQVYRFEERPLRYFMEYLDKTLLDFISKETHLSFETRVDIVHQMIDGLDYIWSKGYLHRDLSVVNIYVKKYDDCFLLKFADFGLVKDPENCLTSSHSSLKGYFNDPALIQEGFENYSSINEVYSLTRMIYFVLTGKIEIDVVQPFWRDFFIKGLNKNKAERFQNLIEVKKAFDALVMNTPKEIAEA